MVTIWQAVRRLVLGSVLIAAAAAVLLVTDLGHRTTRATRAPVVAILQHLSTAVHDDAVRGMVEALAARGFADGNGITLRRFNAQGDVATGVAIARQVTAGDFDLVITSSTPSMQAVANANRTGRTRHVFGIVADPFGAGIGLNRDSPLDHPAHMVGQSIFLPVGESFELARRFLPALKTVGVAWN